MSGDFVSVIPEGMENYVNDWQMSPGLLCGDFLFFTGMTGAGPDGTVNTDPQQQISLAFQRCEKVLSAANLTFADVVEMTSYHVGIRDHIDVFRKIRSAYVSAPYPAWTAIEVAGFVTPGTLCEIRLVARRTVET